MELERVDTKRAYEQIRERITTLELAPGSPLNEQKLAEELGMGLAPVREALKLLAHDSLVVITPRHGLYVADVDIPDLEQLSETRLALEGLSARLAAQRATPDDLVVLEALRQEQANTPPEEPRRLFDIDHKFHQAVARAAHNKYLADSLERLFGLSQRLWYLALLGIGGQLGFLPSAVEKHLGLVEAIKAGDGDRAEEIMREHVAEFYAQVRQVLPMETGGQEGAQKLGG
jgi:DNA-binding GntR family transcriptional regulator